MTAINLPYSSLRLNSRDMLVLASVVVSIIGAGRFTNELASAYVCIAPLLLAIFNWNSSAVRNSLLLLSLFLSIDNGGGIYAETSSLLRYVIYLTVIFSWLEGYRVNVARALMALGLLSIPAIISLSSTTELHFDTYYRDLQIAFLILVVAARDGSSKPIKMDVPLLFAALVAFLLVEIVNAAFLFDVQTHQYLNYDSTKSLLLFPFFVLASAKKFTPAVLLFALSCIAVFLYGTRMLTLIFLVLTVAIAARNLNFGCGQMGKVILLGVVAWMGFYLLVPMQDVLLGFKALSFLYSYDASNGFLELLQVLDPVRFNEHVLFFRRDLMEILFGNGYGSALVANNNEFYFISNQATAFSKAELMSNVYYNLHDTWIDVGLRFGLLFVLFLYAYSVKQSFSGFGRASAAWLQTIVLITCASFSSAGIILCAYFWLLASSQANEPSA